LVPQFDRPFYKGIFTDVYSLFPGPKVILTNCCNVVLCNIMFCLYSDTKETLTMSKISGNVNHGLDTLQDKEITALRIELTFTHEMSGQKHLSSI